MDTETLVYHDDNLGDVALTVAEATVLIGIKRTRLKAEGRSANEEDIDRRLLRLFTYPDVVAATTEAAGIPWPLEFEEFLLLPDHLVSQWEQVVYRLNSHWLPSRENSEDDDQKKASVSTGD